MHSARHRPPQHTTSQQPPTAELTSNRTLTRMTECLDDDIHFMVPLPWLVQNQPRVWWLSAAATMCIGTDGVYHSLCGPFAVRVSHHPVLEGARVVERGSKSGPALPNRASAAFWGCHPRALRPVFFNWLPEAAVEPQPLHPDPSGSHPHSPAPNPPTHEFRLLWRSLDCSRRCFLVLQWRWRFLFFHV